MGGGLEDEGKNVTVEKKGNCCRMCRRKSAVGCVEDGKLL